MKIIKIFLKDKETTNTMTPRVSQITKISVPETK